MTERKLASLQRIDNLEPIPNADRLEVASILGWKAVVQKGVHHIGEVVVYFEIDSFIPVREDFEFLRKSSYKKILDKEGFRIKTVRLRGQVSQGLVMPTSVLPKEVELEVGKDVSEVLGVIKWEPPLPACLSGLAKGNFPSFLVKSDEVRVQLLQEILDKYAGLECFITEKIDGSSVTYYFKDGDFGVCSRNLELKESEENAYWKWARSNNVEEKLRRLNHNIMIQGEIFGEGINNNPLRIKGTDVRFYNVYNIDQSRYLSFEQFKTVIEGLGFKTVPIISTNFKLMNDIDSLVRLSTLKSKITSDVWCEGIVVRPLEEITDFKMIELGSGSTGRLSFKVVNPEFLIDVEK